MSIYESTHKMTSKEQMCFDLGYMNGKEEAVVHAHWRFDNDGFLRCSNCYQKAPGIIHQESIETTETDYCPHCGALMDEEGKDKNNG